MNEIIKFYSVVDEYGEFSNFANYSIRIAGKKWSTTEHYFQAMKFGSKLGWVGKPNKNGSIEIGILMLRLVNSS